MKFVVYRDTDSFRLRKIVIEIYSHSGALLDRSRMFGTVLSTFQAALRLKSKINKRIAKRVTFCQVFEKAGMGG